VIGLDTRVQDFTIRLVLESKKQNDKYIEFAGPANITRETTGAIVNAANSSLLGGGGVDGAIHRAGGPAVLAECRQIVSKIGRLAAGKAVITTGGNLAAKYVIHTVGPIYQGGDQGEVGSLASCHRECIRLAEEHAIESLSFPAISTGAFGYPVAQAAPIAITAAVEALALAHHVSKVRFVLFDIATLKGYARAGEKFSSSNTTYPIRIEKASS
jgi:O-acetyl-ADP-ribose deacetylase (regulator of RNase III)